MKGQTQALTAVLITAVTVGVIASAYVWGTPLLEKQRDQNQLRNLESEAVELYEDTVSAARAGSGRVEEVSMSVDTGSVRIEEGKDLFEIVRPAPQSSYADSWQVVQGSSFQNVTAGGGSYGLKGEDLPGVVLARSRGNNVEYRVEFRNLRDENSLQRIDLRRIGRTEESGDVRIVLRSAGFETDTVQLDGENVELRRRVVEVELR